MEDNDDEVAPVGIMESFILNQGPPTPQSFHKPQAKEYSNDTIIILQKKLEEQGKEILELRSENEILKKRINEAFQNIISIYNELSKYSKEKEITMLKIQIEELLANQKKIEEFAQREIGELKIYLEKIIIKKSKRTKS